MLLLGGFLLYMHLKRTAADPNLRLIAQVTDDISVELVAVASQSRQKDGSIKWWKPNGLPALEIEQDARSYKFDTTDPGFYFLYKYNDNRSGKNLVVRGVPGSGGTQWPQVLSDDGETVVVKAITSPDLWHSLGSGLMISSEGRQYVGELTPTLPKLATSVGGVSANIVVLSGQDLKNVTMFRPSPCVLQIAEPTWKINSQFSVEVFDETGNLDKSVSNILGERNHEFEHLYFFNSRTWSKIIIHRTVYDVHVNFEAIASQRDSITSPRVGKIIRLHDK